MKSKYGVIVAAIALTAIPASFMAKDAKEIRFSSFKAIPSVRIPLPARADSAETGNLDLDKSTLLGARKAADTFHRLESQDWTTILPDTAGVVHLSPKNLGQKASDSKRVGAELYVLATRIRPSRFVKGNLVASSDAMIELFVDGESKLKKSKTDSVSAEERAAISFDPEVASEIEIHLLALPESNDNPEFSLKFVPDSGFDDVEIAEGPAVSRRFSISTTTLGGRLNSTSMSPDGKYVILKFSETYGEGDLRSWTELRRVADGVTITPSLHAGAAWMPAGATLYYTQRNGNSQDLFTMEASTMRPVLAAANVPVDAAEMIWAPDASWFAYYAEEKGAAEEGVMKRVSNPDDRIPGNRNRYYLSSYSLTTKVSTRLTYGGPSTYLQDISPDSRKVLYQVNRETPSKYPFYSISLVEMDVNTLKTDTVVAGAGGVAGALYSPDGKQLLVCAGPNDFDGVGKNAGNHPLANDFDIQAFLLDLGSRKVTPLTKDFDPSIEGTPVWNKADGNIYFTAADGFYTRIYSLNPKSGKINKLPVELNYVRNFSIGRNEARWLSYCGMSYTHNGSGYLLNLSNGRNSLLADPMDEEFKSLNLGKSETWTFTSRNGDVIDGTITLPPDFDASKKYPLIVYYYGGTTPSTYTSHHPYTPQLFASRDYVVYVINPSGTIGYGQEFSARHVNAWGENTADDIIEGVKKFCEEHPFVDSKKIGCIGASYGGFMTQLLQTKTDIFAAAVSHAGISNVTSYWGEGFWGYTYNAVAAAKSYPWSDPELFTKRGSLFNADKIHTPLLLLHGTEDTNVPIGESIQLFNALKILGRDVEFITVEGQNHIITDYNKRKLWQATIMAWFAKYLQDDPRWWNSMYKK
ncbi:MAG: prolyl oligopeptidase family serine peptidase [Muribaculum sp.]|nr:prolyl oligopeptidase family serine peptidase [Muribaculum sp.]